MSARWDPISPPLSRRSLLLGTSAVLAVTGFRWSPAAAEQPALRELVPSGVKSVFFGLSADPPYDHGAAPSCAMDRNATVVEVHENAGTIWWRVGDIDGASLVWQNEAQKFSPPPKGGGGRNPSVALNDKGVVVAAYDDGGKYRGYYTGQLSGTSITWANPLGLSARNTGVDPAIALNEAGRVVEVHKSEGAKNTLWWQVGEFEGTSLKWSTANPLPSSSGITPSVAINNNGLVVAVWRGSQSQELYYVIGQQVENKQAKGDTIKWTINWFSPTTGYGKGSTPSIALTDDNMVYEVHRSEGAYNNLWQLIGRVVDVSQDDKPVGKKIEWLDWLGNKEPSWLYDYGQRPQIACNGRHAVQVHSSPNSKNLYANSAIVFNRASWMGHDYEKLKSKKLKELVLPASHDAGMYQSTGQAAVTQDLSVYSQLSYGVRYFDLRPRVWGGGGLPESFVIHHTFNGPYLSEVLADMKKFFDEGHRELVILKFSTYQYHSAKENFDQNWFNKLCRLIQETLGDYLYYGEKGDPRLADRTISTYLEDGGKILVVCDRGIYPPDAYDIPDAPGKPQGVSGIWHYRGWDAPDYYKGELTVFDVYSNTEDFQTMRGDQLRKFKEFDGTCKHSSTFPCDLFLLSWTLTPTDAHAGLVVTEYENQPGYVWKLSVPANAALVDSLAKEKTNAHDQIINLLYTDYVEYSRSTDVAFVRNGLLT